ncbi:uncharacterized protein LOC129872713 [Solanum dulcamara]|uniref:uncharacterized protein LOC129872713 n=1 Tax=Solanum dulcamara TaxID=45834 RepID=UPI002485ABD0|nr:uncharacterized protein LOC129872713 [Solanum dulcamara]
MGDATVSSFETNTMPSTSRTPVSTAMATAEKTEKFTGIDFKRWKQKMFFYLTTLSLQRFINEDVSVLEEGNPDNKKLIVTEKYKTEDAGLKKFVAAKFLDYKMVDSKTVMSQVQELQVIIHDLLAEGMVNNETFQVAAFFEKLPPSWKDFKNYLKHKRNEMTLEDLIVRLRIEEDNKAAEKKARGNSIIMGENIVEDGPNKSKKRKKPFGPKNYPSKKKFKGDCHNCGKTKHKAVECRVPKKKKKKDQANMVDTNGDVENLCAMMTECNLVGNLTKWWLDSGATSHVCAVREAFAIYSPAAPNATIFIENSAMAKVEGYGRMLIALAAVYVLEIYQIDVKTTFLNGELEEELYIEQPEGFVVPDKENKVYKLVKSLYGLKQAPKQWHAKFDQDK